MKSLLELTMRRVLLFALGFFSAAPAAAGSVGVTVMLGTGLWSSLALAGVGGGESRTSTEKALVSFPGLAG